MPVTSHGQSSASPSSDDTGNLYERSNNQTWWKMRKQRSKVIWLRELSAGLIIQSRKTYDYESSTDALEGKSYDPAS